MAWPAQDSVSWHHDFVKYCFFHPRFHRIENIRKQVGYWMYSTFPSWKTRCNDDTFWELYFFTF